MLPELEPLGMDDVNAADIEDLARLFNAFGQRTRLAILLGFAHGNSTTEIAETLDISRAGLTNHLEKMVDARLLRSAGKGYELTPVGEYFVEQIEGEKDRLLAAWHLLEITEEYVEEELREEVNPEYVSDKEWENMVERELWSELDNLLPALLGLTDSDDIGQRYRNWVSNSEIEFKSQSVDLLEELPEDPTQLQAEVFQQLNPKREPEPENGDDEEENAQS